MCTVARGHKWEVSGPETAVNCAIRLLKRLKIIEIQAKGDEEVELLVARQLLEDIGRKTRKDAIGPFHSTFDHEARLGAINEMIAEYFRRDWNAVALAGREADAGHRALAGKEATDENRG